MFEWLVVSVGVGLEKVVLVQVEVLAIGRVCSYLKQVFDFGLRHLLTRFIFLIELCRTIFSAGFPDFRAY